MSADADRSLVTFDLRPVLRAVRFALNALRRRWLIGSIVALLFVGMAVAAAMLLPREYSGEIRLLARKNYLMPALTAPGRAVPLGAEAPAQSAAELVLDRESLVRIVRGARLVERWGQDMPPLTSARAALRERLKGPLSNEELEEALLEMLRQRLHVSTLDNEIIQIRVSWWTADDVLAILDKALEAFLETRRHLDLESIAETEKILSRSLEAQQARVQENLELFRQAQERIGRNTAAVSTRPTMPAEVEKLQTELSARQRIRMDLERQRENRLAELQAEIAERSATQGDRHPDQIARRQALDRLMANDGGVSRAAAEEYDVEQRLLTLDGGRYAQADRGTDLMAPDSDPEEDASVVYTRAMLRMDIDAFQDLSGRLNNVRIELETARAAFGYRFMVTQPAERPREPDSPNVPMILVGGLMAGLFAGFIAALSLELRRRVSTYLQEALAAA